MRWGCVCVRLNTLACVQKSREKDKKRKKQTKERKETEKKKQKKKKTQVAMGCKVAQEGRGSLNYIPNPLN